MAMLHSAVGVLVLAAAALILWANLAVAQGTAAEPGAVVDAMISARNSRDIDVALAMFADNATIGDRAQTYTGKEEIRRFLQMAGSRGRTVVMVNRNVRGERVSWTERFSGASQTGPDLRVEAIVHEGRIRSMTYAPLQAGGRVEAVADPRTLVPTLLAPGVVVVLVAGAAGLLSIGGGHAARAGYAGRPSGAMFASLQEWSTARRVRSSG
jgi:hypothetical protein